MTSVLASPDRDVDRRMSRDVPNLSLSLDAQPSSSPFPSPSSSFVPPPVPGAHEFASKMVLPTKRRESAENSIALSTAINGASAANVTPPKSTPSMNGSQPSTPKTSKRESLAVVDNSLAKITNRNSIEEGPEKRHSKHSSLSSNRKAPPSPCASRRTSGAHTTMNGDVSRPLSRAPSNATKRSSMPASVVLQRPYSRIIKIHDFAYVQDDPRHIGQGPDAPRINGTRNSTASDYDSGSRRNSGWGAFRWAGNKLWGLAVGGGPGGGRWGGASQSDADGFAPTQTDFERNFDVTSPTEEDPYAEGDANAGDYGNGDDGYPDQDMPLLPGHYRALYAFLPEGTAEMALTEDQIVHVIGRGGGVGWAIAEDENGNHALVPESYLDLVQLDDSSDSH